MGKRSESATEKKRRESAISTPVGGQRGDLIGVEDQQTVVHSLILPAKRKRRGLLKERGKVGNGRPRAQAEGKTENPDVNPGKLGTSQRHLIRPSGKGVNSGKD